MLFKKGSFFIFMYLTKCVLTGNLCLNTDLRVQSSGQVPSNYLLVKAALSVSLADCASSCGLKWKCASFFYHLTTKECRHYSGKISALNLNAETGWTGYLIEGRPTAEVTSLCEASDGYVFDTGSHMCYKVHNDIRTWTAARNVCQQENAEMIMLNTEAKKNLTEGIVAADGQNGYFLGATDEAEEGEWRWVADNSLIPWFTQMSALFYCFELESTLQYDDTSCDTKTQKYVCEKQL